jgi:hypothetical protein
VARKEILLGVLAYTLIRAVIARAAGRLNLKPREISFTRALINIEVAATRIMRATTEEEYDHEYELFLRAMRQSKHPNRSRPRHEPRALVGVQRKKFPPLKGTRAEARQRIIKELGL